MTALGFLYPGHSAEDDYPRLEQLLGSDIRLDVVHTDIGEDAHRVDALLRMGSPERLTAGVEQLRMSGAEAVVWACTSGSFVYGWEGAHDQVRALARSAGLAGVVDVLRLRLRGEGAGGATGGRRGHVPGRRGEPVRGLPAGRGVEPAVVRASGVITAAEVGTWGYDEVLALARAVDGPDIEAVLLPDTALHTAAHIPDLEKELGKPVLTANQVTVWEALRLADRKVNAPDLGALFTKEPLVQAG